MSVDPLMKDIVAKGCNIARLDNLRIPCNTLYDEGPPIGISTGWNHFDSKFTLLKGHLNILTGFPGSGKSAWLECMACNLAKNEDWKIFLFSPECYPIESHMMKLSEKLSGKQAYDKYNKPRMTKEELNFNLDFVEKHFDFVDAALDDFSLEHLIYTLEHPRTFLGRSPDMAIIDPWNELENHRPSGVTETDYIGQSLKRLRKLARKLNISFWIVAHPAKLQGPKEQNRSLSLYDISGSAHWSNKSDNGIVVHRSYKEEEKFLVKIQVKKVKDRHYGVVSDHYFNYKKPTETYEDFHQT